MDEYVPGATEAAALLGAERVAEAQGSSSDIIAMDAYAPGATAAAAALLGAVRVADVPSSSMHVLVFLVDGVIKRLSAACLPLLPGAEQRKVNLT